MKNKTIKIAFIVAIIMAIITILPIGEVHAIPSIEDMHNKGEEFVNQGASSSKINSEDIAKIIKPLASILLGIGTVVLLVVTSVMGIKYITSTPDARAKLKIQFIGLALSAVVLYGAYGIWSLAYNIMTNITA